jgi:hypothetical protein
MTLVLGAVSPALSVPCAICDSLCGPKSLLTACRELKVDASLGELVALSGKDDEEPTIERLIPAAKRKGLLVAEMRLSADELARTNLPSLAMLWGNHIVFVRGDGQGGLRIEDPSRGAISTEEFKSEFTGTVLLLSTDVKTLPPTRASVGPALLPEWFMADFGDVDRGSIVEESVGLRNVGTSDLVISTARTTCGCASTVLSDGVIHPGGRAIVNVRIDTAGRQGMQYFRLYIHSNDPITPIAQLGIVGTVVTPSVAVYPETVDLGSVKHGECDFREITVYDSGGRDFRVTKVEADSPYIRCFFASISDCKHPRFIVVAALSPDAPVGKLSGNVIVTTTHPKNPVVRVPVQGAISAEEGTPTKSVFLGIVPKNRGAACTVKISSFNSIPLKVECAENPLKNISVDVVTKDSQRCDVTVKLDERTPADTVIQGDVTLRTNDPTQPEIKLRVYARVTSPDVL